MRQEILNLKPVDFDNTMMKKVKENLLTDTKFVEDMFYKYYLYGLNLLIKASESSSESERCSAVSDMRVHWIHFRRLAAKSQPVEDALALKYNWEVNLDKLRKFEFLYKKFELIRINPSSKVSYPARKILANRENLQEFLKLDHNFQSRYILHSFDVRSVLTSASNYTVKSLSKTKYLWSLEAYGAYALAMLQALKDSTYMKQRDMAIGGFVKYEIELDQAISYLSRYLDNFLHYWWLMANDLIHQ
jgi:hypothetical protein